MIAAWQLADYERELAALSGQARRLLAEFLARSDPDALYERYLDCRETVNWEDADGKKRLRKMWEAEGKAKRYSDYRTDHILAEMKSRDRAWLNGGEPPEPDYSMVSRDSYGRFIQEPDYSRPPNPLDYAYGNFDFSTTNANGEWRDLFAHDVLRWHGFSFGTRPRKFLDSTGKAIQGATSPDLAFNRDLWGRSYLWEVKSPVLDEVGASSGNLNFIGNALQKAASGNFKNPYDPLTNMPVTDWDGKRRVVLNLLYRRIDAPIEEVIEETAKKMNRWQIHEVLLIDGTGKIYHIK